MTNRLARESSPYLRQHAHNPVDWYPWGPEALNTARAEGRPILLSVGYSSCHWCHVMERESFDDPKTAELMNRLFVNIKVDREERPDVDSLYMRAVQSMTGRGGWPLTVFLTPGGDPFYGGTYYPPEPRHGMPAFRQVLQAVARAWDGERDQVERQATRLREALAASMAPPRRSGATGAGGAGTAEAGGAGTDAAPSQDPPLSPEVISAATETLLRRLDPVHGGFGGAPKFPQPMNLDFLMRAHLRTGEAQPLQAAALTLDRMARGGIRDHLGGGFHRYSVDARWLVPHFEKMLYDNALLLGSYLDGWLLTGREDFRDVAREIGDYVLGDLRDDHGGLRSARDADSEGEEGLFYLWSLDEVKEVLGADAPLFSRCYDVSESGNFEGRNILHLPHDLEAVARQEGVSPVGLGEVLRRSRARLLEVRSRREPPFLDEKVLAGWNGLAIRNLARGGVALGRPDWVRRAEEAARFVLEAHGAPDGGLLRASLDGEARIPAFLEDYGAMGLACLALHGATLDPVWYGHALRLAREIPPRFLDRETGLLFDAPEGSDDLVVRPRDPTDNAIPSGTSLAAELLLRLGRLEGEEEWIGIVERTLAAETPGMTRFPAGFGQMLQVADLFLEAPEEVVIAPGAGQEEMIAAANRMAVPRATILRGEGEAWGGPEAARHKGAVDSRSALYLCRDFTCQPPVTDPAAIPG